MLNIVIPMAGRGHRFREAGYTLPKPLIEIHGKPMIQIVINNLRPQQDHQFIFLCLKEHVEQYQIDRRLKVWAPNAKIVLVDRVTEGAACTVLLAKNYINNDQPLMLSNSDQWVDYSINDYLKKFDDSALNGFIMTMTARDPKWSYVQLNDRREAVGVVEKRVVSNEATVGIYNYRRGKDFVAAAEEMIQKNLRVNNEFYVAPAFNQMLAKGQRIGYCNIGSVLKGMYGLGTPEDLDQFLKLPIAKKATGF